MLVHLAGSGTESGRWVGEGVGERVGEGLGEGVVKGSKSQPSLACSRLHGGIGGAVWPGLTALKQVLALVLDGGPPRLVSALLSILISGS